MLDFVCWPSVFSFDLPLMCVVVLLTCLFKCVCNCLLIVLLSSLLMVRCVCLCFVDVCCLVRDLFVNVCCRFVVESFLIFFCCSLVGVVLIVSSIRDFCCLFFICAVHD